MVCMTADNKFVLEVACTVNYFETRKEKGTCDGVGGTLKNGLHQLEMHNQMVLNTAYVLVQSLGKKNLTYLYIPIKMMTAFRKECFMLLFGLYTACERQLSDKSALDKSTAGIRESETASTRAWYSFIYGHPAMYHHLSTVFGWYIHFVNAFQVYFDACVRYHNFVP